MQFLIKSFFIPYNTMAKVHILSNNPLDEKVTFSVQLFGWVDFYNFVKIYILDRNWISYYIVCHRKYHNIYFSRPLSCFSCRIFCYFNAVRGSWSCPSPGYKRVQKRGTLLVAKGEPHNPKITWDINHGFWILEVSLAEQLGNASNPLLQRKWYSVSHVNDMVIWEKLCAHVRMNWVIFHISPYSA